ncbi:selenium binding protein [Dysgonomonas sp. 521]|uniref:selenium binding protein n=1 Tax=Dysgonomonas sp. 521 TaxID=2302932 RepID=UPI0013D1FDF8|nr:selenium binding protein [Dysgonomonas sp. 521]NDV97246.1 selenium binding protein [Dysgonomonas sp. 521]
MYEDYTRQALPSKKYRELLGSAISVFNSNNAFIIENILRSDDESKYNWYDLIDRTSGRLNTPIKDTITRNSDNTIADLFEKIVDKRNRIIHSFQITDNDGEQRLATKDKDNIQYKITEEYLISFIKENELLSDKLHHFRGY